MSYNDFNAESGPLNDKKIIWFGVKLVYENYIGIHIPTLNSRI